MAAAQVVDSYLEGLDGSVRRLAHAEWGLTLPDQVAGGPLDVGLRIADGLLRAQAFAVPADESLDGWMLLWWNRQTRVVRFGSDRARNVWVQADLPVAAVEDEAAVDRLLGLVVEAVTAARDYAARSRSR
jgi:hypothetical protein